MKHSHLVIMVIGVILVGLVAALMPRHTAKHSDIPVIDADKAAVTVQQPLEPVTNMDALLIDGKPLPPLCFAAGVMESEFPSYPVTKCDETVTALENEEPPPFSDRFVTTVYQSKDGTLKGAIGYRYLGDYEGSHLVWVVESPGGSGVFSSLMLLNYNKDTQMLETARMYASGDRCNGSVSGAQIVEGVLLYQTDVTPADILALGDTPIEGSTGSIPFCAACCYGIAQYSKGALAGVQFDERLVTALEHKTYNYDETDARCFDQLVVNLFSDNKEFCDTACIGKLIEDTKQQCLAGTKDD